MPEHADLGDWRAASHFFVHLHKWQIEDVKPCEEMNCSTLSQNMDVCHPTCPTNVSHNNHSLLWRMRLTLIWGSLFGLIWVSLDSVNVHPDSAHWLHEWTHLVDNSVFVLASQVVRLFYKLVPNWSSSLTAFTLDMLPSKPPWSMDRSSKCIPSFFKKHSRS